MGSFMWRPILKNFMHDCSLMLWDHKFMNGSNLKYTFVEPVTIKQPRKMNLLCEGRHKSCQVILKAVNANYLKTTMPARFHCTKLLPASYFSTAKRNHFKMEQWCRPSKGRRCITDVIWKNEDWIVYKKRQQKHSGKHLKKKKKNYFWVSMSYIVLVKTFPFMYQLLLYD